MKNDDNTETPETPIDPTKAPVSRTEKPPPKPPLPPELPNDKEMTIINNLIDKEEKRSINDSKSKSDELIESVTEKWDITNVATSSTTEKNSNNDIIEVSLDYNSSSSSPPLPDNN